MELGRVCRSLLLRQAITMRRYLFNTVAMIASVYIVFLLMFTGVRAMAAPTLFGSQIEGLVVGYVVWMLAVLGFAYLSQGITQEAQTGTLEKLYLSPVGFRWVSAFHQLAGLLANLLVVALLLGLITVTTGVSLRIDLVSVLPLVLVAIVPAYGFGYLAGGLALVYKRVEAAFQILQFVFVAFLVAPDSWPLARYLPFNLGVRLLTRVMVKGLRLWQLDRAELGVLLGTGAFYLLTGVVLFTRLEKVARERGLLGHY
jgi:ABC-2 type transport system permease protein